MLCAGLDEKGIRYGGGGEGEGERHDGKQAKKGGGIECQRRGVKKM